jgi:two-component system sensor histidine kinase and response regulator WspE
VSDDGRGLDAEAIRNKLVERQLSPPEVAARLSPEELSEFIFLPGFSSRSSVTEISGRGVGLDLVRQGLGEVGGQITCELSESLGVHFEIQLPLALNILQCLLVEVGRQTYALPLARLDRVAQLSREQITTVEGRPWWAEENMCLTLGTQILGFPNSSADAGDSISVVSFHHHQHKFGLVVDRLLGKQKLVSQRIDARLGKLQHVASGAILQNGSPALILDVEDLVSSMAKTLENWQQGYFPSSLEQPEARKRVLVVDDSITVREVERNLLQAMGYQVDVAVDGVDGWNAVRAARYDLVVSDIDMPRMDGFELVKLIKADPQLASLPILIVSYKDREEDKLRGLEAGADGYLTKASFHDHKFAQAVRDLIG